MTGGNSRHDEVLATLRASLAAAVAEPSIPRVVVLFGETGRGKTYEVQRLFDELAAESPGYWSPGLTPDWPPRNLREVNRSRKQVIPEAADRSLKPSFYWVGAGASPVENAIQVEMASSIGDQLVQQLSPVATAAKRRKSAIWESLDIALDVVGNLLTPVGITKSFAQHAVKISQMADAPSNHEDTRRQALFESFHLASKEQKVPMIVAVDDASAASAESLYLLSGLISQSAQGLGIEALLNGEFSDTNQFLPFVMDTACPAPLLFVCTVWEHRLKGEYQDPFLIWIEEMERLGSVIEWIPCMQFQTPIAASLLEVAEKELDQRVRNKILKHITSNEGRDLINPLVLTSVVGQINENRELWGRSFHLDDEMIASLPSIPEQHTSDRVEELKKLPGLGAAAYRLLTLASHCSHQLPSKMLQMLSQLLDDVEIDEVIKALCDAYLWTGVIPFEPINRYRGADLVRVDPDVQRFLQRVKLPMHLEAQMNNACADFLEWLVKTGSQQNMAPFGRLGTRAGLTTLAKRVLSSASPDRLGALAAASAVLGYSDFPPGSLPLYKAFGYALDCPWVVDDHEILSALAHLGRSDVAKMIITRRLKEVVKTGVNCHETIFQLAENYQQLKFLRAKALASCGRTDEVIVALEADLEKDQGSALLLFDLYMGRMREDLAIRSLRRGANNFWIVAQRLVQLLITRREFGEAEEVLEIHIRNDKDGSATVLWAECKVAEGRPDIAIATLRHHAREFPRCARALARLLVTQGEFQEAADILEAHKTDPSLVSLLAEVYVKQGLVELAIKTLEKTAARYAASAVHLAKLLDSQGKYQEAVQALSSYLSSDQNAALLTAEMHLRNNEIKLALEILDKAAERFPDAVLRLAELYIRLERPDNAIRSLEPQIERLQDAAMLYAQIEFSQGRTQQTLRRLEPVAPRFRNLALLLAKMFQWTEPEKSVALITPWAGTDGRAAALLVRLLLRRGALRDARQHLKKVHPANTRKGLSIVLDLLEGAPDQALNVLESESANTFYILNTVLVNLLECGRPDLVGRITAEVKKAELLDRVLASFMLAYARRAPAPDNQLFINFIDAVWPTYARARRAATSLENTLWLWVQDPDLLKHSLDARHALSILQLLQDLPSEVPPRLRQVALERIKDHAQGVPAVYQALQEVAFISSLAVEVLDDVLSPANWSFEFEEGNTSDPSTLSSEE